MAALTIAACWISHDEPKWTLFAMPDQDQDRLPNVCLVIQLHRKSSSDSHLHESSGCLGSLTQTRRHNMNKIVLFIFRSDLIDSRFWVAPDVVKPNHRSSVG